MFYKYIYIYIYINAYLITVSVIMFNLDLQTLSTFLCYEQDYLHIYKQTFT